VREMKRGLIPKPRVFFSGARDLLKMYLERKILRSA
jgi:hypothetical protein